MRFRSSRCGELHQDTPQLAAGGPSTSALAGELESQLRSDMVTPDICGFVLLVDDDELLLESTADLLRSAGHRVETARHGREACARIRESPFDAVVCDVHLPDRDGFGVLEFCRQRLPAAGVILMTGQGEIEGAVRALRGGAIDYLEKPVPEEGLLEGLQRVLERRRGLPPEPGPRHRSDAQPELESIIGGDPRMLQMFDLMESVASTRTTTLILGESGTGKTMTARAIHRLSPRRDKPFVEVACGTLSDTLLESELFGHVAGSFTGAQGDKVGKFLQADGGTLFLDEIANASSSLQVKLLRVLQDREFEPVGGARTHRVDVRLILATNADLEDLVARGEFRKDLYYRINVVTLMQPPLRERRGDIRLLLDHFLKDFCRENGRTVLGFDEVALQLLERYRWPGNVRELVNVVERAVVLTKHARIGVDDLPESIRCEAPVGGMDELSSGSGLSPLKSALAHPERKIILNALQQNGWSRQGTAETLGINRTTLYKKMKKYGIDFERLREQII
ncbi:MAG: sigma-54-dependent transcriptional regulator [Planctomycetales bacterium]